MPDALRCVSIHYAWVAAEGDDPITVDLALPASVTVGELIPSIVDACGTGDDEPRTWRLCTVGGPSLDESTTLAQNDIHDGDLLLLAAEAVPPARRRTDSVTAALTAATPAPSHGPGLVVAACFWSCLSGTVALIWAGLGAHGLGRVAPVALLAVAVTVAAAAAPRVRQAPAVVATLNIIAVAQIAAAGFLIVPAGPGAANVFLAAVAAVSAGALMLRFSDCGTTALLAVVTFSAVVAVACGCAVFWPLGVTAFGATLGAAAAGTLSVAPRLSIIVAGLTPPIPGDAHDDDDPLSDIAVRAGRGHRTLTGLITGCAAAAALGSTLVAVGVRHAVTPVAVAFTTAVVVALALRTRSYASGPCRTALSVAGLLAATATFALVVLWSPRHGTWTGLLAVGLGLALLGRAVPAGPVISRIADVAEYLALVTIVPLACWLTGVLTAIDNLGRL